MGIQPSLVSCDDRKRNCEEEQKEGEEGQKKEESLRRKIELILNCSRELEKLRYRLSEEPSSMTKSEDFTQLLQQLIKEQSLEQTFWSNQTVGQLTCKKRKRRKSLKGSVSSRYFWRRESLN